MWKNTSAFFLSRIQMGKSSTESRIEICMALATRNRLPGEIAVKEVASGTVYSCKSGDDMDMNTMWEKKIRRLPVVSSAGKLEGIEFSFEGHVP
jgi:hypothetical protein